MFKARPPSGDSLAAVPTRRTALPAARLLAVLAALALAAALSGVPPVQGQTATVLVKNTGKSTSAANYTLTSSVPKRAQAFTTGSNDPGYTPSSIGLRFGFTHVLSTTGSELTATLNEEDSGDPGDVLCTLTDPASFVSDAVNTFSVPSGDGACPLLKPTTTYFIVLERANQASGSISLKQTAADTEDDESEDDWSIADGSSHWFTTNDSWTPATNSYMIEVTGAEAAPNVPATGAPSIRGILQQGETLTADTAGGIEDENGIPEDVTYAYQWVSGDGATDTDIEGATGPTYIPTSDDLGRFIKVRVSFTDGGGFVETLTSAATDAVVATNATRRLLWLSTLEAAPADAGTIGYRAGTGGSLSATAFTLGSRTYQVDAVLSAAGTLTLVITPALGPEEVRLWVLDPDGDELALSGAQTADMTTFQWADTGVSWNDGATAVLALKERVNVPVFGDLFIALPSAQPTVGEALGLFVGIIDHNGAARDDHSYQWSADGVDIPGATASAYWPADSDAGKTFSARMEFTDGDGFMESIAAKNSVEVLGSDSASVPWSSTVTVGADGGYLGYDSGSRPAGAASGELFAPGFSVAGVEYTVGAAQHDLASSRFILYLKPGFPDAFTVLHSRLQVVAAFPSGEATEDTDGDFTTYSWSATDPGWRVGHRVAVALRLAVNRPATGAPSISGPPQAGHALTADTSGIIDEDGKPEDDGGYAYQWIASDGGTDTEIAGADGQTYTLTDSEAGQRIRVRVSFTDGRGFGETLTSGATSPVAEASATSIRLWAGTMTVGTDTSGYGYDPDPPATYGSLDDDYFTDQGTRYTVGFLSRTVLGGNLVIFLNPLPGSGEISTWTLTVDDGEEFAEFPLADASPTARGNDTLYVWANTGLSWDDEEEVFVSLKQTVNAPATGKPVVTGEAWVDETLTADPSGIEDENGIPEEATFTYQWTASDGATDTDIDGAEGQTYTLTNSELGKLIKVRVSFTDSDGFAESLTSDPTGAVTPPPAPNSPATGAPTTSGTAQEGNALGVDVSGISDGNGIPADVVYSYRWLADGVAIVGAEAPTYWLAASDIGKRISVEVAFTDSDGYVETLTSARTATVTDDPTLTVNWSATMTVGVDTNNDFRGYGAPSSAVPNAFGSVSPGSFTSDGDPYTVHGVYDDNSYELFILELDAELSGVFDLELGQTTTLNSGSSSVTMLSNGNVEYAWARDKPNWTDGQKVAFAIREHVDFPPTGLVTIDGAFLENEVLTANTSAIEDANGLAGVSYSYQWGRSDCSDSANDGDISGATGSTRTLTATDVTCVLSVKVTFQDDAGFEHELTATFAVAVMPPVNAPATGAPTISGEAAEGISISADMSGIEDGNGIPADVVYSYRWQADGVAIVGAEAPTYWLAASDIGKRISVEVTFTDSDGFVETLTSVQTTTVTDDPTLTVNWSATMTAGVNTASGYYGYGTPAAYVSPALGSVSPGSFTSAGDPYIVHGVFYDENEAGVVLVLSAELSGVFELGLGQTTTLNSGSSPVTMLPNGNARYSWGLANPNWTDGQKVAFAIREYVDFPPTGQVTIDGTFSENEVLTANTSAIEDANGLAGVSYSYQWGRSDCSDSANDGDISGATGSTRTLTATDVTCVLSVKVTFQDDAGFEHELTATFAVAVMPPVNAPATGLPAISGEAQEGNALGVDVSGIGDGNGIPADVVYSYRWLADGVAIVGAEAPTYWLAASDIGKRISVEVTFTDSAGYVETLTSARTATVTDDPTLTVNWSATMTVGSDTIYDNYGYGSHASLPNAFGSVSPGSFTSGGDPYTGHGVYYSGDFSQLNLILSADLGGVFELELGQTTTLNSGSSPVTTLTNGNARYAWSTAYPNWTAGQKVAFAIREYVDFPATGAPATSGEAAEGISISADVSGIEDGNGIPEDVVYSYQWQADGVAIVGAEAPTYWLAASDIGKRVSVEVAFTDSGGFVETLTSARTATVTDDPTLTVVWSTTITAGLVTASGLSGFTKFGNTLGSLSVETFDARGNGHEVGQATYSSAVSGIYFAIKPDLSGQFTLAYGSSDKFRSGDATPGPSIFDASFTAYVWNNVVTSTRSEGEKFAVAVMLPVDFPPTGEVTIDGAFLENEVLTANTSAIEDANGLAGVSYSYQWGRSNCTDSAHDGDITGATAKTYTLTATDVTCVLSVKVTFEDDAGFEHELTATAERNPAAVTVTLVVEGDNVTLEDRATPFLHVQEEAGAVRLGLRAVTNGDSRPAANFQITVQSPDVDQDDDQVYTAEAGLDYQSFSQTFFFAPSSFQQESGRYVHTVWRTLSIVDDAVTEKTEDFDLLIGEPTHADVTLAHSRARVEILDSDVTTLSLTCLPADEGEPVTFRITADKPVSFPFTVTVGTVSGTAILGSDYTGHAAVELFSSNQVERTFTIATTEDINDDGDKTFEVVLYRFGTDTDIMIENDRVTCTIRDNGITPPGAPEVDVSPRDRGLFVTWTVPEDGGRPTDKYQVQWKGGGQGFTNLRRHTVDSREDTISPLGNGARHLVQVRASNNGGADYGAWSIAKPGTPQPLPVPTGFTALWPSRSGDPPKDYYKTQNSLTVSWFVVRGADEYQVEYRREGETGDWTRVNGSFDRLPSTTRGHRPVAVATGLDCDTKYRLRVRARNQDDPLLEPLDGWTPYASTQARTGPCALPEWLTNVLVTLEPQCADLSWTAPSGGQPSGYKIQRYLYDTPNEALETIEEDTRSAAATYSDCSREYRDHEGRVAYYITALGAEGFSVTSILSKGSFEQPEPPRNVRLTQDTQFVRRLEWDQAHEAWRTTVLASREGRMRNSMVTDPWPTRYQVERREFTGDPEDDWSFPAGARWEVMRSAADGNTSRTYTDSEDRGSRLYVYRVIPHNSAGTALEFRDDWAFDGPTYTLPLDNVQGDDQQQDPAPTVAEEVVWSADMLVVEYTSVSIGAASADLFSNEGGSAGLQVKSLWSYTPDRDLRLAFEEAVPGAEDMTLQVGDLTLAFPAGSSGQSNFRWDDVDVDWEDGQTISVRIVKTTATAAPQPNSPATGAPAINGTARVDETLTANTSAIADDDGLDNATFAYQWVADDTDIGGASNSTYTLVSADEGKTIKVKVSFTDDADHEETLTSAATAAVAAKPNSPATGQPTISGTVQVGETLAADTTDIADADGLTDVVFSYQWLADDVNIDGATDSTHILADRDEGKAIKVQVSFTDDAGNEETLTSTATAAVEPALNSPATGAPTISGTAQVGETLTADITGISDADGLTNGSYSYQWMRSDGNDDTDISGESASTYTLVSTDQGKTIKVRVSFTDDADNDENLTSAATAAVEPALNSPATGAPTISGTAQVGETLAAETSGISDADGMTSAAFTYQWLAADANIQGATDSTYTLADRDESKAIKVKVSFTDDRGHGETLTSAATDTVAGPPPEPLTASLENTPDTHDGETPFTFELRFSEEFALSYKTLKFHAFDVTDGEVLKAQRMNKSSNIGWLITVEPSGNGDVTITLPVTTDCTGDGAICTEDGRRLSNRLELTVSGPSG